jgi:cytoskeletal protein CcmA (bactofilin family)
LSQENDAMKSPKSGLEIHPGIVLKGQLSMVKDIVLTGRFEGDLRTEGCLTVSAGGTALGTIEAGALVLEPGNLVEARVKVTTPGAAQPLHETKPGQAAKWPISLKKLKQLAMGRA